jgi:hypothetical protein
MLLAWSQAALDAISDVAMSMVCLRARKRAAIHEILPVLEGLLQSDTRPRSARAAFSTSD